MSYGLRRYETIHRLWWFVFFILCLFVARYSQTFTYVQAKGPELKDLKKTDFWTGLRGIAMTSPGKDDRSARSAGSQSGRSMGAGKSDTATEQGDFQDNVELVSSTLLFLIRAGIIFLELRLVWLIIQFVGRYLLQLVISETTEIKRYNEPALSSKPESIFPVQALAQRIRRSPLSYLLHPFIRLKMMLSGVQKSFSSEDLLERERRVVDADWQILYGSWGPYRILFWVLPILGLAQTVLLLVAQFNAGASAIAPVGQKETFDAAKTMLSLAPQKEILDAIKPVFNLLLPLIQAAGVAVFFQLASTLLRYLEELYLSNLDSFIYDRLLAKLPLRSNDTLLILEAIHGQFREFNAALKRLEHRIEDRTEVEKPA